MHLRLGEKRQLQPAGPHEPQGKSKRLQDMYSVMKTQMEKGSVAGQEEGMEKGQTEEK